MLQATFVLSEQAEPLASITTSHLPGLGHQILIGNVAYTVNSFCWIITKEFRGMTRLEGIRIIVTPAKRK